MEAIIAESNFTSFKTEFENGNDTQILNPHESWKWYSDNIFYNTFYIKCTDPLATLPDIKFTLFKDGNSSLEKTIEGEDLEILSLEKSDNFSRVLAKSLTVKKSSVSYFDDQSNIIVMEISSRYANLLDFKLNNTIRDGIESSTVNFPDAQIYYFAIVPNDLKRFSFTYFDLMSNNFEQIFIPIILDNHTVSTQTNINPKKNRFELYKSVFIASIAGAFFILFLIRRKKIYLLIAIIIAVYVSFFRTTFNEVVLKPNSNVSILPTKNSTLFFKTSKSTFVERLNEKDNYMKIMLPNSQIGWVKKDRIEKN